MIKERYGQALIITIIIIALIMAIFADGLTTVLRYHSTQETEIYQREQALYLAEAGVNQMLYNINSGIIYSNGDSISGSDPYGIGSYITTYYSPDTSGFSGSAYIKSVGVVGEYRRTIYTSIIGGITSEAFKYCLYTAPGGSDGVYYSYFTNFIYGSSYLYNTAPATLPYPDTVYYSSSYAGVSETLYGRWPIFYVSTADLNNVVYIHTVNPNATLIISFANIYDASYNISFITDAKNVYFTDLGAPYEDTYWYGAANPNDNNLVYPILVHFGTGTVTFDYSNYYNDYTTLHLYGFLYTYGGIDMEYNYYSYGEIDGEVMEQNPVGELGGPYGDTQMSYVTDYYNNPPPHFIIPGSIIEPLVGSFREEY